MNNVECVPEKPVAALTPPAAAPAAGPPAEAEVRAVLTMLPFAGGHAGGLAVVQVGLSADSKTATSWEAAVRQRAAADGPP
jgi:hypothetical protein